MEGKTVILSVLMMTLVLAQTQVESKICCPSMAARKIFNSCRFGHREECLAASGCIRAKGTCPNGYNYDILENSGEAVNGYCKLGCASSVCGAINALQNSDASELVNEAVKKCAKACSSFCTKGSATGVEIA